MSLKFIRPFFFISIVCCLGLSLDRSPVAQGAINTIASPVQAGCYLIKQHTCKIHVEPFSINFTPGKKLVFFRLLATRARSDDQQIIYDFRPDVSNPVPFSGDSYTPSQVAKDFAATCGESYFLSLQAQDTGDAIAEILGTTNLFSCPVGSYTINLPIISK